MRIILPILVALTLMGCQSRAENANAEIKLEMSALKSSKSDSIPVGVQVLPAGQTYDINRKPGHLVVIDFNADWCAPCLRFMPIFDEAAEVYAGQVEFISVDVEQHQELVQQLGITSIPLIVFIQPDGKINTWKGFLPKDDFFTAINQLK